MPVKEERLKVMRVFFLLFYLFRRVTCSCEAPVGPPSSDGRHQVVCTSAVRRCGGKQAASFRPSDLPLRQTPEVVSGEKVRSAHLHRVLCMPWLRFFSTCRTLYSRIFISERLRLCCSFMQSVSKCRRRHAKATSHLKNVEVERGKLPHLKSPHHETT